MFTNANYQSQLHTPPPRESLQHLLDRSEPTASCLSHIAMVTTLTDRSPGLLPFVFQLDPNTLDFHPTLHGMFSFVSCLWSITPKKANRQLPGLMKAGEQAYNTWTAGQKAWTAARSWIKGWTDPPTGEKIGSASGVPHEVVKKETVPDAPPVPDSVEHGDGGSEKSPLWGPTRCCISCVSPNHRPVKYVLTILAGD